MKAMFGGMDGMSFEDLEPMLDMVLTPDQIAGFLIMGSQQATPFVEKLKSEIRPDLPPNQLEEHSLVMQKTGENTVAMLFTIKDNKPDEFVGGISLEEFIANIDPFTVRDFIKKAMSGKPTPNPKEKPQLPSNNPKQLPEKGGENE